jgi:hypothetical protein
VKPGEIVDLDFEAKPRNLHSSSPCAQCGRHKSNQCTDYLVSQIKRSSNTQSCSTLQTLQPSSLFQFFRLGKNTVGAKEFQLSLNSNCTNFKFLFRSGPTRQCHSSLCGGLPVSSCSLTATGSHTLVSAPACQPVDVLVLSLSLSLAHSPTRVARTACESTNVATPRPRSGAGPPPGGAALVPHVLSSSRASSSLPPLIHLSISHLSTKMPLTPHLLAPFRAWFIPPAQAPRRLLHSH